MRAILVGSKPGPAWQGKLEKHLSKVGVEIVGVWRKPGDPARRGVFAGATGILLTNDCCSHTLQDAAKIEARRAELPLIVINHRWASCSQILANHGITAESAETTQGESNMARGRTAKGPNRLEWEAILAPIIRKNPQMSIAQIGIVTREIGTNTYTRDRALRDVRGRMGWAWSKTEAKFMQSRDVPPIFSLGKTMTAPEQPPEPPEPVQAAPEPLQTPPAAPEPAEAPTEAATGLHDNVQAALGLLLGAMRQNDVEHVELWATGKANFRCRIVTYTAGSLSVETGDER